MTAGGKPRPVITSIVHSFIMYLISVLSVIRLVMSYELQREYCVNSGLVVK
jgi:hypothetical protein